MAIEELGFSLLGRAEKQRQRRRREQDKADKYALIGSLAGLGIKFANKALEKKANSWLQDEEILASQRNQKRAYDSSTQTLNEWDTASSHAGGVVGYLGDQIRPEVERRLKMNIEEEALMDPDAFDRTVDDQVQGLIGTRDGDGLYGKFYKARNAALNLSPDSEYKAFIEAKNPAYRNTLDLIVGKINKDAPDRETYVSNVLSSRYATNAKAYNAALDAYQRGLSGVSAVKLGDAVKEKLEFKPEEQVTKREPYTTTVDGLPITVTQVTTVNRKTGLETITYEAKKGDERGEAFVNNQLTKTEERTVTDPYTGVERKVLIAVGAGGVPVDIKTTGMSATFKPPVALGDVTEEQAKRIEANFLQAFLSKPDGQDKLDEFRKLITLGDEGVTEVAYNNILKTTHLTSMAIQDKIFGGENVQQPLRASQSFQIESERVSMDLAAEIMTLQQEYAIEADTKGVGLIQNLMSEVVGERGNIRGPLVLFGLDRLNRRSEGTYDLSSLYTPEDFQALARATVSVPEMERFNFRTEEEKKYLREIIVKSIEDSVQADGTNRSVFMIPYRKDGPPIATLFGYDPFEGESRTKVPPPVIAAPEPETDTEPLTQAGRKGSRGRGQRVDLSEFFSESPSQSGRMRRGRLGIDSSAAKEEDVVATSPLEPIPLEQTDPILETDVGGRRVLRKKGITPRSRMVLDSLKELVSEREEQKPSILSQAEMSDTDKQIAQKLAKDIKSLTGFNKLTYNDIEDSLNKYNPSIRSAVLEVLFS